MKEPQLAIFDTSELPQKVKTHFLREKPHKGGLEAVVFCGTATNKIITGGKDKQIILWKTKETGNSTDVIHEKHTGSVKCLYYNDHQSTVFSGGPDRKYIVYSIHENKIVNERRFEAGINNIANQPTNPFVISVSQMSQEKQLNLIDTRCQSIVMAMSFNENILEDKKN